MGVTAELRVLKQHVQAALQRYLTYKQTPKLVDAHREKFGRSDDLLIGLQLTHSGRFCRPSDKKKLEPKMLRCAGSASIPKSKSGADR